MKKISDPTAPGISARFRGLLVAFVLMLSIVACFTGGFVQTAEGLDPHVVRGTVYEANGTTCNNCNVTVANLNTGENSSGVTSNATGVYGYNLLNLPSGWSYGDTIQVTATNATGETGTNSTTLTLGSVLTDLDVWIGTATGTSGVTFLILDENLEPLENAYINIKDSAGDIVVTKISGSNGKASYNLGDGLFGITVSKSGYDDETITIRVHGASTYTIILGLEAEAGITVPGFTYWLLVILALIGVVGVLSYVAKKY